MFSRRSARFRCLGGLEVLLCTTQVVPSRVPVRASAQVCAFRARELIVSHLLVLFDGVSVDCR